MNWIMNPMRRGPKQIENKYEMHCNKPCKIWTQQYKRLPCSMSNEKNKTEQKWNNGSIQHCIYSEKQSSLSFQISKARVISKCIMVFLGKNAFKYGIFEVVELVKRSKGE